MRILHVVTDMRIANGIMSVVLNYAKHMPDDIVFDVAYFKEFPENRKADMEALGGKVYKLSRPGLTSFFHSDWDDFFQAHKNEYAAIHIHAPHLACMIVPKARKIGIKTIAVHCHSTWYSLFPHNKLRNKLLSLPVKRMPLTRIACGQAAGEFWYGKGNFVVLPNAVDCAALRYDPIKRETERKNRNLSDKFVVGHLGRVSPPQKNHPFLLKIFSEIRYEHPTAELLMIGAEETEELNALARTLGIENAVHFLGQRTDVYELLACMDVFVFPSFYEGLPVSVVEAQAAGLPVVMSNTVTNEVCCTPNTVCLSLSDSAKKWADTAIHFAERGISDTYDDMQASGWDIHTSASRLAEFYRSGKWDK